MTTETIVVLFLIGFGLLFGYFTAQSSNNRQSIHSSGLPRVFHYLSAAIMSALTPTILLSIFVLHLPFVQLILLAVGLFVLAILLLIPFAVFEKPLIEKAAQAKDQGWTEENARTSGL